MENWRKAAEKFLSQYINEDYFIGAILTGSYATGNNHRDSDIDLFIITKDSADWRERGNRLVDGFMIEYFINPVRQIVSELDTGFDYNNIATTLMFAGSEILYDTDGTVKSLVDRAKADLDKDIKPVSAYSWNMNCYNVWHSFYELTAKYNSQRDIDFSYNIYLNNITRAYLQNKRLPLLPVHKIEKILTDENYVRRYNLKKLPEKQFSDKLLACFNAKEYSVKYQRAKELYDYFMAQHQEFDINNFSFRSKI